jgi:NAD dependent epimerase/dehydratase family enzyme
MRWVCIDDVVATIQHILVTESFEGPINLVTPYPVTNAEFTKTLGRLLHRPTIAWMPACAARLVFGEMADELLLASTRAEPRKLEASGYEFQHPMLEGTLMHLFSR